MRKLLIIGASVLQMPAIIKAKELGFDAVLLSPGGLGVFDEEYLILRTQKTAEILPVGSAAQT